MTCPCSCRLIQPARRGEIKLQLYYITRSLQPPVFNHLRYVNIEGGGGGLSRVVTPCNVNTHTCLIQQRILRFHGCSRTVYHTRMKQLSLHKDHVSHMQLSLHKDHVSHMQLSLHIRMIKVTHCKYNSLQPCT